MKVKIIESAAWHKGMVGQIVETTQPSATGSGYVTVIAPGMPYNGCGLYREDYEVVRLHGNIYPQPMKIRVTGKAHSALIQRTVFRDGGRWSGDGPTTVQLEDKPFLYVSQSGYITQGSEEDYFNDHSNVEHYLDYNGNLSLKAPELAKKFVTVEGVKYEVPGDTKFVTRDDAASDVYAWNGKPEWKGAGRGGYNHHDSSSTLKATRIKPYVEPMPVGNFIIEVA